MDALTQAEKGFLLLTSHLGVPDRKPLTAAQLRQLSRRVQAGGRKAPEAELLPGELMALGYTAESAERIWQLLQQTDLLDYYLEKGRQAGCVPIARVSEKYPLRVRKKLGQDAPGCLWAKGDITLLAEPMVALVGSRDLAAPNREFARQLGRQAALQGYTLVSGNARGADKTAQQACLAAGGRVISVVADSLQEHDVRERVLYLAEDSFDACFTAVRALSRNRVIHSLTPKTFVAQATFGNGGTWDGTVKNLRHGWSSVFCFDDASASARELEQLGGRLIGVEALEAISQLSAREISLFENP